jgi:hypothetical protein
MRLIVFLLFIISISCTPKVNEIAKTYEVISNENYQLFKPTSKTSKLLFLFPGFPEEADDIKREFKILDKTLQKNIAVVMMNYNQKLWLEQKDKKILTAMMLSVLEDNNLNEKEIYLGGYSSGGNVSLLIGNHLVSKEILGLKPKGIFIIDSPLDMHALYKASEKNIARNFSDVSVNESTYIINMLEKTLGNPDVSFSSYEQNSVFTSFTENFSNVENLKNVKLRFYSEPDFDWWKENRMADPDQLNAIYIEKLSQVLNENEFREVEYISTKNRGFRANGERHPHSWSIVEIDGLLEWIEK